MKELERCLKALANKRRLAIVKLLRTRKEATVGEIAAAIKLSFKATSRHLAVLKSADIVEHEQRSISYYYRLASTQHPATKSIISIV
ncbi:MAG: hypothetical protein A3A33_01295 [Candidatus Yanofskybacteria bacterium RIFCSPLOWO2_01_FULL_49_25]|uniref:HTH arsR-type domain-containing protein n=1 Tax=Candidatus Yanofskybacteria bacterium RIFCSPLOWO2_01_FULL_49_25 TaxID=1802701 RepID=A0A1F8GXC0_9BACT|nr:MAG: hypothetical protein A3A33_01295 [Candidatus Yanofskybacteria bacterium RIFCSPLOWO2_01_FULL_49_25]